MIPMMEAAIALTNTAAAARSFTFFIEGFFSIEIKSARFSIDELMSSKEKTNAKERRMTIHSEEEIFKK